MTSDRLQLDQILRELSSYVTCNLVVPRSCVQLNYEYKISLPYCRFPYPMPMTVSDPTWSRVASAVTEPASATAHTRLTQSSSQLTDVQRHVTRRSSVEARRTIVARWSRCPQRCEIPIPVASHNLQP